MTILQYVKKQPGGCYPLSLIPIQWLNIPFILAPESGWDDVASQGTFLPWLSVHIKNELALRDEITLDFANLSVY